jgi:membrane-associated phospholipid phosphatase
MIDQLIAIDKELFLAINQGLSNPVFDWLLPVLRNPYTWAPLYLFIIVFCIRNYKKRGAILIAFLLLNFGLSDYISSTVVKKSVERIRPCNDIEFKDQVQLRVRCGSGYSFTSSHATNHFAMAIFMIVVFFGSWKPIRWIGLTWASVISLSQVYVGVHYPGDIIVGAILGTLIGGLVAMLYLRIQPQLIPSTQI